MYGLQFSDKFRNDAKKLDNSVKIQLNKKLEKLKNGQVDVKPLRGRLAGKNKIRLGNYRIIYKFIDMKNIELLGVELRDKIYKK